VIAVLGYVKVAAATPSIKVADCAYNAEQIIALIKKAEAENIRLLCMPELCITGSTCGDLFSHKILLESAKAALLKVVAESAECRVLSVVGLPMEFLGKVFNVAAVFCRGNILGFVPKENIPSRDDVSEFRHFTPAFSGNYVFHLNGQELSFGTDIIFECKDYCDFMLSVEVGEDTWVQRPPSVTHTSAGATIIANISASGETVGKAAHRRMVMTGQSERLLCAYVYANAGYGESTTDKVFSAHNIICENGKILAESPPFGDGFAVSEIDLHALNHDRRRAHDFYVNQKFKHSIEVFSFGDKNVIHCESLTRKISPYPFVPEDENERATRCTEIITIQAHALAKRLEHTGAQAVLGVSGGLDSTLALLVSARAYEKLGADKSKIVAVTMPCFGTTERTKGNAYKLCEALGIPCREIDITEMVRQHLRDINHPEDNHDITYENTQARVRTLVLMNLANQNNGLVIGSGGLSELALGWATYNGDHMSMYGVNAGVPKTLVRHIVQNIAVSCENQKLKSVLEDILATPVSPELLPPENGEISQHTEDIVGPYELHDFFIYHTLRKGREPSQILELANVAFNKKYPPEEIKKWLKIFISRFFSQQFKRNCLPESPKIGSVSLSPRGDWRMPSDAMSNSWTIG